MFESAKAAPPVSANIDAPKKSVISIAKPPFFRHPEAHPIIRALWCDYRNALALHLEHEHGAATVGAAFRRSAIELAVHRGQTGFRSTPVGAGAEGIDHRLGTCVGIDREHRAAAVGTGVPRRAVQESVHFD